MIAFRRGRRAEITTFLAVRWSAPRHRNMLMKEYRICMPLTVEEVSSALGALGAATYPGFSLPRRVELVFVLLNIFPFM